jgi:hypothetical protein
MPGSGTGEPITFAAEFTVEDGTGLAAANTYATVAEADTYLMTVYGPSTAWAGLDTEQKQTDLIQATQYLDAVYQGRWRGARAQATQALAWPRNSGEDDDGFVIPFDSVPQKLKDACCELALRVASGDVLLGVVTETGGVIQESKSVGPITVSRTYAGAKPAGYEYPKIDKLLKSLIQVGGRLYRG